MSGLRLCNGKGECYLWKYELLNRSKWHPTLSDGIKAMFCWSGHTENFIKACLVRCSLVCAAIYLAALTQSDSFSCSTPITGLSLLLHNQFSSRLSTNENQNSFTTFTKTTESALRLPATKSFGQKKEESLFPLKPTVESATSLNLCSLCPCDGLCIALFVRSTHFSDESSSVDCRDPFEGTIDRWGMFSLQDIAVYCRENTNIFNEREHLAKNSSYWCNSRAVFSSLYSGVWRVHVRFNQTGQFTVGCLVPSFLRPAKAKIENVNNFQTRI